MALHLYQNDLPDDLDLGPIVAVDCETMGLNPVRDRLCLVQLSSGDGHAHLVQVAKGQTEAPNLVRMIKDENVLKLFHRQCLEFPLNELVEEGLNVPAVQAIETVINFQIKLLK